MSTQASEARQGGEPRTQAGPWLAAEGGKRRFASDLPVEELTRAIHYTEQPDSLKRLTGWQGHQTSIGQFLHSMLVHKVQATKDGRAFVPGCIIGDNRNKKAVAHLEAMVFDLDRSRPEDIEAVLAKLRDDGLAFFTYTTYSHLSTNTEVSFDKYQEFAKANELDPGSAECARRYLREIKGYDDDTVRDSQVIEAARQTADGLMVVLRHGPMLKLRLILILDRPFVIAEWLTKGFSEDDVRTRLWSAALETVAREYGLSYDKTCKDVSRTYYPASCPPAKLAQADQDAHFGMALRLDAVVPATPEALDAIIPRTSKAGKAHAKSGKTQGSQAAGGPARPTVVEYQDRNIGAWCGEFGHSYELENALRGHVPEDKFRSARSAGGTHMECPFEEAHSTAGGSGFFVVNASDNGEYGFSIYCSHQSCQAERGRGNGVDRAVYIAEFLRLGWLTLDDLENPELGGGPVPWCETTPEIVWPMIEALPDRPTADHYMGLLSVIAALRDGVEIKMVERIVDTLPEGDEAAVRAVIKIAARLEDPGHRDSARCRIQKKITPTQKTIPPIFKTAILTELFKQAHKDFKSERKARQKQAQQDESKQAAADRETARDACKLTDRFKWVLAANGFMDTLTGEMRKVEAVYRNVKTDLPRDRDGCPLTPDQVMLMNPASKFDRLGYRPDQPVEYIDVTGLRCLNTYKPPSLAPVDGDVRPMLDHVQFIFGRNIDVDPDPEAQAEPSFDVAECNHFLDWLAYKVQRPEVKVRHSVLVGSGQGVGKGTIAKALERIVGAHNFVAPTHEELLDKKHEYLEHRLWVVVHEVYDQKKTEVANILKPIMSEDTIRVKRNYLDRYEIENLASWLMFTNRYNAISVENGDRRYFLYDSKAKPRDKAYYTRLHDWLDRDGAAIFLHWLLSRDVSGFNPNAPAPMTAAKRDAIEASEGDAKVTMRELFDDGEDPFHKDLVKLQDIQKHLSVHRDLKVSRPVLVAFLKDRGAEPLDDGSTYYTKDDGTGHKDRMWALRDAQKWRAASPRERGAEFLKRGRHS